MISSSPSRTVIRFHILFAGFARKLLVRRRNFARTQFRAVAVCRLASVALVLCLLLSSTPAAPRIIVGVAQEWSVSFAFWLSAHGIAGKLYQTATGQDPAPKAQEKQEDRDVRVSRIEIYPGNVTVTAGQTVIFSAAAYDYQDSGVGGVSFNWSARDVNRNRAARISKRGDFMARVAGTYTITAEAASQQAQVTVTVTEGRKRDSDQQNQSAPAIKQVSSRDLPSVASMSKPKEQGSPQTRSPRSTGLAKTSLRRAHPSVPSALLPLPIESSWDSGNYWSADEPSNRVGNPPGAPPDGGSGNGNFEFGAPVLGLPGRGIDVSLGLIYNSRLWNKAGSEISYDIDKGWPGPGWNLGFGKLLGMGVANGSMIVDPDGTRHAYTGTVTVGPNQAYTDFAGHTTDGTLIDYTHHTGLGGAVTNAQLKYPNGTVIEYSVVGTGAIYPARITDANGNYITITYVNNTGPQIQTITDTLGRIVNFYYDTNGLLTAITAPGLTTGTTRTLVRLHYKQLTLNYGFSGLTARVTDTTPWVLDAIYYPATSTGYWFGDSDSYSSYGMIARVRQQRAMTLSAASLTVQGTVTKGTETNESAYSYPLTPNYALTDAPTYTTRTDTWDGMDTAAAVTNYLIYQNTTPRRTEITLPNGTKSVQLSYNAPGTFTDGLFYQSETYGAGSSLLLQKNTMTWEQGAYESPRPARMEATDERSQKTATEFDYGASYNQVTEVRNYDYGGLTLLRATRTQYETSANYTNRHIFNLPLVVEVFAANNTTRVSRTEYQYDGQTLDDTPGVVMHNAASDPYTTEQVETGQCCQWVDDPYEGRYCAEYCLASAYDPSTDYRGNVTQVKNYADAAGLTGAIAQTRSYDINGNLVTASTSCCEQMSFTYTSATQYAYPASQKRGSATNTTQQVTTSATYSFNTGLTLSTTDANSRTTQIVYQATDLRPQKITLPTGGYTLYAYDNAAMSVTETAYLVGGTVIAAKNIKSLNGLGQVAQEQALTRENNIDYWDVAETMFDNMGRTWKQSLPYRSGQTPQWSETFYDALSRVTKTKAPDGSEAKAFYNEAARPVTATTTAGQTVRSVDAWGKERWGRTDASGRLVEIIEPDPAGNGLVQGTGSSAASLVTKYTYDTPGNLTLVTQGTQLRKFKYDSLGRLTAQKLAEPSAMLNDAGTYVTTGGLWSDVFTYDTRSNLISRVDARGVETNFNYNGDPLNRLQSVSWDITGFGDTANPILAAPTVSYTYMTTGDRTRVDKVTTTGVSTKDYSYDTEGRVSSVSMTLTTRAAYPQLTDYTYDSLNRVTDVRYPTEYGNGTQPRKLVHQDFDVASRLTGVKLDGVSQASTIVYNPASQATSVKVGTGTNQITESYAYEALTGLLSNQKVQRGATILLDLTYDYLRAGTTSGRTGQLTDISNNLDHGKDRAYEYDALARLKKATGGSTPSWTQTYVYDRYGNRTSVTATGTADDGSPIPRDGFAALAYGATTNRITTAGWQYDAAGNQVRAQTPGGVWQRFQYDAANRLVKVKADNNVTVLATYTYGDSNERLITDESGYRTYYACDGGTVIAEYSETPSLPTTPKWSKSYVYLGGRLLSTLTPNGSGGEAVNYHHPDRLGTRLVTDPVAGTSFEQVTLPFGTALDAESTDASNRRFTSYDRSDTTGLDYAVNRHYDPQQGRFTQVDPIGMGAASIGDPQSLNTFTYTQSDPVNSVDPSGLMGDFPSAMYGFDHFVNGFWGWGNLAGWGRRTGFDDIRDAEPRVAIFTFDMAENILDIWVESSMFDVDPQNPGALAPNGLASDRRLSDAECDKRLAQIFGGDGAVVGSTRDPLTVGSNPAALAYAQKYGLPTDRIGERAPGHGPAPYSNPNPNSPDQGGIIHIYGNDQGTASNTPLYAPSGGRVGPIFTTPSGNVTRRVSYGTGLGISFVHVIPGGGPDRSGSVTLGTIGGPDSGGSNYRHTHIVFFDGRGNRVDPRKVFCGQ
jgi:RHS repeat-associated protein